MFSGFFATFLKKFAAAAAAAGGPARRLLNRPRRRPQKLFFLPRGGLGHNSLDPRSWICILRPFPKGAKPPWGHRRRRRLQLSSISAEFSHISADYQLRCIVSPKRAHTFRIFIAIPHSNFPSFTDCTYSMWPPHLNPGTAPTSTCTYST